MSHITLQNVHISQAAPPQLPICLESTQIKICLLVLGLLLSIGAILGHVYHLSAAANYAMGSVGGVLILTALALSVVQRCLQGGTQGGTLAGQQRSRQLGQRELQEQERLYALAKTGDRAAIEEALNNGSATSLDYLLHAATRGGHGNLVALLLRQGADPRKVSAYDVPLENSALHIASQMYGEEKSYEVMKILLDHDPTLVTAVTVQERSALHVAACGFREATSLTATKVKLLLAKGADVHAKDNNGETPLHHAAMSFIGQEPNITIIELLVKAGADCKAKNDDDKTAFQLAEQCHPDWYNRPEIQKRLQALL